MLSDPLWSALVGLVLLLPACGRAEVSGDRSSEMAEANAVVVPDLCSAVPAAVLADAGFDGAGQRETTFLFDGCTWEDGDRRVSARVNADAGFARASLDDPRASAVEVEGAEVAIRYEVPLEDVQEWRLEVEAIADGASVMIEVAAPVPEADAEALAVDVAEAVIAHLS